MASRRARKPPRRVRQSRQTIRAAAARAVDQVLSSEEAFALLVRKLEAAGYRIERDNDVALASREETSRLTPPPRAR